jgi:hypothetical protein
VGHGEREKIGRLIGGDEVGVTLEQGDNSSEELRLEKTSPVLICGGCYETTTENEGVVSHRYLRKYWHRREGFRIKQGGGRHQANASSARRL